MLEILVTIVVMSFGFLSLAAFQINLLKSLSNTNHFFQASLLAQSIGESVRANNDDRVADNYGDVSTTSFDEDCSSTGASCTISEQNIFYWQQALKSQGLANVEGTLEIVGNNSDIVRVTITWDSKDVSKDANGQNQIVKEQYVMEVPL